MLRCDQTFPALLSVRKLASTGEGNRECLHLWELLECSICDPWVGVRPGPPVICASFCNMVFKACSEAWFSCSEAYFSVNMKKQALSRCGLSDILCGKAHKWVANGTELCRLAGFVVQVSETSSGVDDAFCYGGKASFDSISDSWTSSKDHSTLSSVTSWDLEDFHRDIKSNWLVSYLQKKFFMPFWKKKKRACISGLRKIKLQGKKVHAIFCHDMLVLCLSMNRYLRRLKFAL